ncbi:putative ubiquitin-conjugating enzyme E2-18 kDa [Monocercomonoides exilis]|uniref:putative ubiquitin-conjugating enzyme E2-18 kDa n=1 Tax=Monocercomonoides exilis TaxID=2049356 RepID=UPI00355ABA05|nr:putative ubiquitin-conjugating enzyme E2-18 kDa [Monocercomonoides exilis]|eukprot:MONOS_65.1-p1 / transcript=MONOS_65.1 / gene=MONOS_65 / organism=Monocercomonoides_exilis_PA203 / gene_product=ubiquitin-conjugating enzyme E2-18 kDa / transcript_product=ubiquitin-conjugating enzyme E2-18 kDa / location=Mono_scaffold00001:344857-345534(-) / protein_length=155 / sequence_SO=supercontig / SO=protein_coding / is_pseudo=false
MTLLGYSDATKKRIMKDIQHLFEEPSPFIQPISEPSSLQQFDVRIFGPPGSIFDGENFRLRFWFPLQYPYENPKVTFVPPEVPMHPHVYSNGHICLSVLYSYWKPSMTVFSTCLSILTMLSSAKNKGRPFNDSSYVMYSGDPRYSSWVFDEVFES